MSSTKIIKKSKNEANSHGKEDHQLTVVRAQFREGIYDWAQMILDAGGLRVNEWEGPDEICASIMSYAVGHHKEK